MLIEVKNKDAHRLNEVIISGCKEYAYKYALVFPKQCWVDCFYVMLVDTKPNLNSGSCNYEVLDIATIAS